MFTLKYYYLAICVLYYLQISQALCTHNSSKVLVLWSVELSSLMKVVVAATETCRNVG
jgi:hypothetical protein